MKTLFSTQKLLNWFEKNQRSLPWRQQYNPYQVWVSEVMLQQTRVDQMLSYYKRFLKQFPSIQALAQAREETVLKSWEGLGYYARARNLHKAAQQIVSNYNGKMPSTKEELKKLPGFGDYIASAVSSIAFNQSNAVVDGNVFRVIARFFGIQSDIANAKTKQEFQSIAEKILPPKKSRYFNQALMELGALVCVPQEPFCEKCPLQSNCFAFKNKKQNDFPVKTKKPKKPTKIFAAVLVQEGEKVWLKKRKQKLLHGLWEFPLVPFKPLKDSKKELEKQFEKEFFVSLKLGREIGRAEHSYTHFHQIVVLFSARSTKKKELDLIGKKERNSLPLSKVNQKLAEIAL